MKPFLCKVHGPVEPYVTVKKTGRGAGQLLRQCPKHRFATSKRCQQSPKMREWFRDYYRSNKMICDKRGYDYRRKIRLAVIASFGGKCDCCGIKNDEFLSIDHINGGGSIARQTVQKGQKVYRDLFLGKVNRDEYRVLCMNCNFALGHRGYCPHQALASLVG